MSFGGVPTPGWPGRRSRRSSGSASSRPRASSASTSSTWRTRTSRWCSSSAPSCCRRFPSCEARVAPTGERRKECAREDVGSLPVVENGGRVIGMVTDRDIVVRAAATGGDLSTRTVADVASGNVEIVRPDQDLDEALQLMALRRVRRLPVVEEGRLVGILAQADVAKEAPGQKTGEVVEEI